MDANPISPAILYWGTPVVLISTTNPDGTTNIAPMSSAFWLGNRCMLGLARYSQTPQNLLRTQQCVLNLPSDDMVKAVNSLAKTTGTEDVPVRKAGMGYRYEKDKFGVAGLTPATSTDVTPPRIRECPVQMECRVVECHPIMNDLTTERKGAILVFEVEVLRTYVRDDIRMDGHENRVDPDKWRPMIMSFQKLYGLGGKQLVESRLAEIDEEHYRGPAPVRSVVQTPLRNGSPVEK